MRDALLGRPGGSVSFKVGRTAARASTGCILEAASRVGGGARSDPGASLCAGIGLVVPSNRTCAATPTRRRGSAAARTWTGVSEKCADRARARGTAGQVASRHARGRRLSEPGLSASLTPFEMHFQVAPRRRPIQFAAGHWRCPWTAWKVSVALCSKATRAAVALSSSQPTRLACYVSPTRCPRKRRRTHCSGIRLTAPLKKFIWSCSKTRGPLRSRISFTKHSHPDGASQLRSKCTVFLPVPFQIKQERTIFPTHKSRPNSDPSSSCRTWPCDRSHPHS